MLWQDRDAALSEASASSGPDFPTTFGETFQAAWSRNNLYGQQYTGETDRFRALDDYLKTIKQKGGPDLAPELDYGGTAPGAGGILADSRSLFKQTNDKLTAFKQNNPAFDFQPMSDEGFDQAGLDKRRQADADYAATVARPRGRGATAGLVTGGVVAGAADPINIAGLPLAPAEGLGILANALRWGGIGLGTQFVSTAMQAPYREQVQPGYVASGEPFLEIAQAGLTTAAGGAVFRGLADVWDRVRTGAWPQSVKQAGDVVSSQSNILGSNVYPGTEGEVAHEQALPKAIGDILAGRPVDVSKHITPELEARAGLAPIETARTQAQAAAETAAQARVPPVEPQPELPFARTAAEAEAETAKQTVSAGVEQIARGAGYAMPAEEAARVSDKLMAGSPEQAQDMLRDLQISPRQVADAPAREVRAAEEITTPVSPVNVTAPDFQAAARADLDRESLAQTKIPVGVDAEGKLTYQGVDDALKEVDAYKTAAEQIAGCIAPAPEEPAEAA